MALDLGTPLGAIATVVLLSIPVASCRQGTNEHAAAASLPKDPVTRGEYLVRATGCEHCHTPGGMYGQPDPGRKLAGSDLGWKGVWGVRYAGNLTPDMETGIGSWSQDEIVHAIQMAQRPDGTPIQLPMPWFHYVYFSDEDARAIAIYLETLHAIKHRVPNRVLPSEDAHGVFIEVPPPPEWDKPQRP